MSLLRTLTKSISLVRIPKFHFSSTLVAKKLTDEITLTDECIKKIEERQKDDLDKFLRIEIEGGVGCSGYSYNFRFDNSLTEEDYLFEKDNRKYAVIDELTLKLLKGATIDYENVMIRSGFVIATNPNAEKSCSCKTSFTPKESVLN